MQLERVLEKINNASPNHHSERHYLGLGGKGLNIPLTTLRSIAREEGGYNRDLSHQLWKHPLKETRILACLLEDPAQVTPQQAEQWMHSIDSWILCDICCNELLCRVPFAQPLALEWTEREPEQIKRGGFSLIAALATYIPGIEIGFWDHALFSIRKHANDTRPYVLHGVARALRQIGKINIALHEAAVETAEEIRIQPSKEARWIGTHALADLRSTRVLRRFH